MFSGVSLCLNKFCVLGQFGFPCYWKAVIFVQISDNGSPQEMKRISRVSIMVGLIGHYLIL